MPPEVERRLFEPFFTTKPSGTGLGLAMVYNLVQRHAGRVHLTTAPGRGTTLRLWFPPGHNVTPTTTRSAPAASAPAPGVVASTRGRLLVVEDEPAARRALRSLLEDEGFTVETAATGEDALPLLRAFQPQALVLDLHLPGIDGTTVAREARARNPSLPVIFMSGSPELGDAVAPSFDGPPAEHVGKPVDLDRLLAVLDRALAL
jgi:CheY-like chemotaxis protein